MACEPCIRGHRSTKCQHANERLMVPVKKPGRPLTACPHLQPQSCGCSSITAAIPRKSQCGCTGGNPVVKVEGKPTMSLGQLVSPTTESFKVRKISQMKSKKQSVDLTMLSKMNPESINVMAIGRVPTHIAPALPGTVTPPESKPSVPSEAQNINFQHHTTPPLTYATGSPYLQGMGNIGPPISDSSDMNGGTFYMHPGRLPEPMISQSSSKEHAFSGHQPDIKLEKFAHISEQPQRSCCSSKDASLLPLNDIMTGRNGPIPIFSPYPISTYTDSNALLYNTYAQQTTIYSYPASYGSYQNPIQPAEWRQNLTTNLYAHTPQSVSTLNNISNNLSPTPLTSIDLSTLHSCGCGDTCQCIGCAAHPYNDATQEYVRSAWRGLREPLSPNVSQNIFFGEARLHDGGFLSASSSPSILEGVNNNKGHNGYIIPNNPEFEDGENQQPSPSGNTPSDAGTSGLGDEQLNPSDFFFVNYPISAEGCGGDTMSCPCGDDCQCLGCTIHRIDDRLGPLQDTGIGESLGNHAHTGETTNVAAPNVASTSTKKSCCG